jgi:hypothetical protein
MRPFFAALFATAVAGACASEPRVATTFVVLEENATIPNRHAIRRTTIVDNDVLLIETRPRELYRVQLFPNCVNRTDMARPIRIQSAGMSVTRLSQFRIGNRTCSVRSITRVQRVPRDTAPPAS